jgi:hypothetical protein
VELENRGTLALSNSGSYISYINYNNIVSKVNFYGGIFRVSNGLTLTINPSSKIVFLPNNDFLEHRIEIIEAAETYFENDFVANLFDHIKVSGANSRLQLSSSSPFTFDNINFELLSGGRAFINGIPKNFNSCDIHVDGANSAFFLSTMQPAQQPVKFTNSSNIRLSNGGKMNYQTGYGLQLINSTVEIDSASSELIVSNGRFTLSDSTNVSVDEGIISLNNLSDFSVSSQSVVNLSNSGKFKVLAGTHLNFSRQFINTADGSALEVSGEGSEIHFTSTNPITYNNLNLSLLQGAKAFINNTETIFNNSVIAVSDSSQILVSGVGFRLSNSSLKMAGNAVVNVSNSDGFYVGTGSRIISVGVNNNSRINISNSVFAFDSPAFVSEENSSSRMAGLYIENCPIAVYDNQISGVVDNMRELTIVSSKVDFSESELVEVNLTISDSSRVAFSSSNIVGGSSVAVADSSNLWLYYGSGILLDSGSLLVNNSIAPVP